MIVAGGAALGYALTRKAQGGMTPKATGEMQAAMTQLDSEITKARSQLRGGAEQLAKLPVVRSVVVTNPETARDAVEKGELNFSPNANEVIVLGQVIEGKATTLVAQPADAKAMSSNGTPGSYADLIDNWLAIREVVEVIPVSDDK